MKKRWHSSPGQGCGGCSSSVFFRIHIPYLFLFFFAFISAGDSAPAAARSQPSSKASGRQASRPQGMPRACSFFCPVGNTTCRPISSSQATTTSPFGPKPFKCTHRRCTAAFSSVTVHLPSHPDVAIPCSLSATAAVELTQHTEVFVHDDAEPLAPDATKPGVPGGTSPPHERPAHRVTQLPPPHRPATMQEHCGAQTMP